MSKSIHHEELQRIFTATVLHARKQRKRAVGNWNSGSCCYYRTQDGLSCFAGCHIKDEFYNKEIEGTACISDEVETALSRSGMATSSPVLDFVRQLQLIHDTFETSEWERLFSIRASLHGLIVPEPTTELPLI